MKPLITEMSDLFSKGESFALATVVTRNGSAPRSAGARMLVRGDGSTSGTVGGGILEAQVEVLAREVIQSHRAVLQAFHFSGKDAATMDAICGGEVEVLVEWMDCSDNKLAGILKTLREASANRRKVWLVTALAGLDQPGMQALVTADGGVVGSLPAGMAAADTMHGEMTHLVVGDLRIIVEPLDSGKTVYIFGAGHVSHSLAAFTQAVGFRTVVLDDRADYASHERFPNADELIVLDDFESSIDQVSVDSDSFIVIVTRGHLNDHIVLAQALKTNAGYIGMIGSRRKCAMIFAQLEKDGFNPSDIARVHAPIGLAIEAETPEEIGISIVAEMIRERAKLDQSASHTW